MRLVLDEYKTGKGRKHSKIIGHRLIVMKNNNELEGNAFMTMRQSQDLFNILKTKKDLLR
jgi:hypothetical protein